LGYVPQGREIFPRLTVLENLQVGLQARDDGRTDIPAEVYELFPVLEQMQQRPGGNLSGGQQQQLAIARALVGDPDVLLLDEPTEGIQPSIILEIEKVLVQLKAKGKFTIVLVEQYFDFARQIADSFFLMDRGSILLQGQAGELSDESIKQHLTF
jgi:urea transport system ATP-binding protein